MPLIAVSYSPFEHELSPDRAADVVGAAMLADRVLTCEYLPQRMQALPEWLNLSLHLMLALPN
jgi:hypothetical protein